MFSLAFQPDHLVGFEVHVVCVAVGVHEAGALRFGGVAVDSRETGARVVGAVGLRVVGEQGVECGFLASGPCDSA